MVRFAKEEDYVQFSYQKDHFYKENNLIAIDSGRLVLRAIRSGTCTIRTLLCPESFYANHHKLLDKHDIDVLIASVDETQSITGFRIHQGVMAIANRSKDTEIHQLGHKVVILNGVNNSENIGAIVRNAVAFGAGSLIIDRLSCTPWVRRAIRVSMGAIFKCQVHHTDSLFDTLLHLKELDYFVCAAEINNKAIPIHEIGFKERSAVIIGCEGDGIQAHISEAADQSMYIPIEKEIDSLNASVATGIILHQLAFSR